MKFRTEVNIKPQPDSISYKTEILSIGSCFADEIGLRLKDLNFPIDVNPAGIIFNPVSIADFFKNAIIENQNDELILERDSLFYHYGFHSKVYGTTKSELKNEIEAISRRVKSKLLNGNVLLITFGTAWVYRHIQSNQIVANCHKIPQKEFTKELLSLDDLKRLYSDVFKQLVDKNPSLKIMLTVSPVRHVKDGVHENNLSKSVLLLLTDYLVKEFEQVNYFPAYELIVDDLRDYRFYKEDLIHPTKQAVDYVFDKFSETHFSEKTKQGVTLQKAMLNLKAHRSLHFSDDAAVTEKLQKLELEFNQIINA
jgi:hypothetical protein